MGQVTTCRPLLMTPGAASPAGGDGHDPLIRQLLAADRRLPDDWKPLIVEQLADLRPAPPATNGPVTSGGGQ